MFYALHVLFALLGLLLMAASLPLLAELLVLSLAALLPERETPGQTEQVPVRLAVVIPAHNEQRLIGGCVRSLAGDAVIYVVAHNCTDATAAEAAAAGAEVLVVDDSLGGKGRALDFGFRHAIEAGAEAVLVVDADSVAGPGLITAVAAAFARGAEALQCRYEVRNPESTARTRLAALALLGMNVLRPLGRERMGLSCGIFGNGFALRATTLARVPYTANSLVEDLEYHLHLLRGGVRVEFLNQATVLGEMPDSGAAAATQRARWEGGRMLMRRLWAGPLALEVLRGRGRMLEPLLDLLAVPLATEAMLLLLAFALGLGAHLPWVTSYALVGLLTLALYVVVAASLGPDPRATLRALVGAPGYLAWKILLIPKTRRAARKDAAWVRTERNADGSPPTETL